MTKPGSTVLGVSSTAAPRPHIARPALGVVLVTTAALTWGFNGTVSKLLIQGGYDPVQLTALRTAGAFLGLLTIILITRGPRSLAITGRELPRLVASGALGMFGVPMLYFFSISRLPVGIGLLFEYTAPAVVALWLRFGEGQQVHRRLWAGLALCLLGLASVAELWAGELRLDALGVLAGLAAALLLAGYYVLGARSVASRDPMSATCWMLGVAAVASALVRPWWNFDWDLLGGRSEGQPMWLLASYLIVGGTLVPFLLLVFAMRHLPPTSVGILGMTEILLASAFAWVLLGEALNLAQIAGGVVLVAGVVLAESARVTRTPAPAVAGAPPTAPAAEAAPHPVQVPPGRNR